MRRATFRTAVISMMATLTTHPAAAQQGDAKVQQIQQIGNAAKVRLD